MRTRTWKLTALALAFVSTAGIGFALGAVRQQQPHMTAAVRYLERANQQLDLASADKGGHRVKAKELIAQAIQEVKAGMEFADKH